VCLDCSYMCCLSDFPRESSPVASDHEIEQATEDN
jgi:hypothetical protein